MNAINRNLWTAIVIDRDRPSPQRLSVTLRMLRYETKFFGRETEHLAEEHAIRVPHRSHTARETGLITIMVASAATLEPDEDVAAAAFRQLDTALRLSSFHQGCSVRWG